ncbi:MAG: nitroreductase family protein [Syntrophales bacterium LBB04]|nr:nitroreductase family protein [Syntrophales bacterium LBB04]
MKKKYLVREKIACIICVALAFVLLESSTLFSAEKPSKQAPAQKAPEIKTGIPATSNMDTLTAIFTRRSIRSYTNEPVSDDTVKLLLQAAMAAPSAKNTQSWEFIVIRDKKTLGQIPSFHPFSKQVPNAQLAIVVCGNTKLQAAPGHWIPDASNASMNILLAAHSLGLGAVWTTFYPYEDRTAGIRKLLNLPDHIMPLNNIRLGYSTEKGNYQVRFKPDKVHYEKW